MARVSVIRSDTIKRPLPKDRTNTMKLIILTFAAIAVSFAAQAPAAKVPDATAKPAVKKHGKKHAKKAETAKPAAATVAPAAAK